jgi:hypothetical protein
MPYFTRSSVAPTVRPTPLFSTVDSSDATLTRWSHPSYPSAASLIGQTLFSCRRRLAPVHRPSSPSPAISRVRAPDSSPRAPRRTSAVAAGRRTAPPHQIPRAWQRDPWPRVCVAANPGRAPPRLLAGVHREVRKDCFDHLQPHLVVHHFNVVRFLESNPSLCTVSSIRVVHLLWSSWSLLN